MARSPFSFRGRPAGAFDSFFGEREVQVLEALWRRPGRVSVRDIMVDFPKLAYTTLMTTMDRLHRKGLLQRAKEGRAYLYWPRYSLKELKSGIAQNVFRDLLDPDPAGRRAALSFFVDALGERDDELLDELEALVREKRQTLKGVQ
jgi:predicted transcriptional regulator